MSRVDTDIESLERTLRALQLFERQTSEYARQANVCLDEFEEEVESYYQKLLDWVESHEGDDSQRRDEYSNELDRMLYESNDESRRELAVVENQLDTIKSTLTAYYRDKDRHTAQLGRLMRGDVAGGGTSVGLAGLINVLRDYLDRR